MMLTPSPSTNTLPNIENGGVDSATDALCQGRRARADMPPASNARRRQGSTYQIVPPRLLRCCRPAAADRGSEAVRPDFQPNIGQVNATQIWPVHGQSSGAATSVSPRHAQLSWRLRGNIITGTAYWMVARPRAALPD